MRRVLLAVLALVGPLAAQAEEGGLGHYTPGANASFIDALPGHEGLAVANFFLYYPASAGFRLPLAGLISVSLDATAYADSIVAVYQTPLQLLGGSYAFGGVFTAVWMDVSGTIEAGSGTRTASDSLSGIADLLLYPFMLGWTSLGGDLKYDFRLGVYAPTGKYEAGSIVNVGKNYWTFEPTFTVSFISSKIGLEGSAYAALDFNTRNQTTDYLTGDQFHVDATIAEHLPLLGGFCGVGASAFYYQQFTGDSGSGAKLGDFKGRTIGVGPVLSYAMKLDGVQGAIELKWLPELEVKNRLKGNYFWIKAGVVF
jgi:hypothetical protein